jgi:hypothetical protein
LQPRMKCRVPKLVINCKMNGNRKTNLIERSWKRGLSDFQGPAHILNDKIVFEHLQNNGFQHIADVFKAEAGLSEADVKEFRQEFAELKDLILKNLLAGRFDVVRQLLKSQFPDFFKENRNLKVELQILEFIQIVKKADLDSALFYARTKLIRYVEDGFVMKEKLKERIRKTLTVLAFRDLGKFPQQALINSTNLFRFSNKINKMVSIRHSKESKLEKRQNMIRHFQDWLIEEKSGITTVESFAPLLLASSKGGDGPTSKPTNRTLVYSFDSNNVYVD